MQRPIADRIKQNKWIIVVAIILSVILVGVIVYLVLRSQGPSRYQMRPGETIRISRPWSVFGLSYGLLDSPNYPGTFPVNMSAGVIISTSGRSIKITFLDIDLQSTGDCAGEQLEISGSKQLAATGTDQKSLPYLILCGDMAPEPIVVQQDYVFIKLFSDEFSSGLSRGFRLRYEFVDLAETNGCLRPDTFMCQNRRCINNNLTCNGIDDCGDASDEDATTPCQDQPTIRYSSNYECGLHDESSMRSDSGLTDRIAKQMPGNRIVGGHRVTSAVSWPSYVSIQLKHIEPIGHICGGTLIHPMFVLTAAHCCPDDLDFRLVFGATDLRSGYRNDSGTVQVRYPSRIFQHPGASLSSPLRETFQFSYDLALIELNAPIIITAQVWPACLPSVLEPTITGRRCLTAGFGSSRGTGQPTKLKQVEQIVKPKSGCKFAYGDLQLEFNDYHMICAFNMNRSGGPCHGDSGGPLVCIEGPDARQQERPGSARDRNHAINRLTQTYRPRFTLHGVASYIKGYRSHGLCGLEGIPAFFVRVSTKVDWILSVVGQTAFRLGRHDAMHDIEKSSSSFGNMFRNGSAWNLIRPLTIGPKEPSGQCNTAGD